MAIQHNSCNEIPFVDLKAQYLSQKGEFDEAIAKVVSETAFIGGRYATAFETSFAEYLGVNHCIAVANGTDAIEIALQAIGVEPGEVRKIVDANQSGREDLNLQVFQLLVLELWMQIFIDGSHGLGASGSK